MLPLLQPDLTRLDAIQSRHGISDREAHQVLTTALNEHFQHRQ